MALVTVAAATTTDHEDDAWASGDGDSVAKTNVVRFAPLVHIYDIPYVPHKESNQCGTLLQNTTPLKMSARFSWKGSGMECESIPRNTLCRAWNHGQEKDTDGV